MTSIQRTYPQPDSPREDLGPRLRALNLFKYLLGIEPEEAKDHPRFEMVVNAFENTERRAVRAFLRNHAEGDISDDLGTRIIVGEIPEDAVSAMLPSVAEELSSSTPARAQRFAGGPGRDL